MSAIRLIQRDHKPALINERDIWRISTELLDVDYVRESLKTILIPRVPGTEGHEKVKKYLIDEMSSFGWHVDTDKFTNETPIFGDVEFENIIATPNPNAERYLTLACHYDSKYMTKFEFLGATDSAVPCAIMLNLARTLYRYYKPLADASLSLQFIFFDGEEAFQEWTATDSIYGARHLAAKWEEEGFLEKIVSGFRLNFFLSAVIIVYCVCFHLQDLFVLLDLLGASNPTFYSYIPSGDKWFKHMMDTELRLNSIGGLMHNEHSSAISKGPDAYFQPYSFRGGIEDDHVPFMKRNVRIRNTIEQRSDHNLANFLPILRYPFYI